MPTTSYARRSSDFGRVSEEVRHAVAKAVGDGVDTMPAVAQALQTSKTTASHALRHLSDDGYVERKQFSGQKILYTYTLVRMPPAPKKKRGRTLKEQPVFVPDEKCTHSTEALWQCLTWPPLPQGRSVVTHRMGAE